jgi:hypothetical protein
VPEEQKREVDVLPAPVLVLEGGPLMCGCLCFRWPPPSVAALEEQIRAVPKVACMPLL